MLEPGRHWRRGLRPQHRLAGCRVELQAPAGGADQLCAVAIGEALVLNDLDLARPAACQRTSYGRRRSFLRRIV